MDNKIKFSKLSIVVFCIVIIRVAAYISAFNDYIRKEIFPTNFFTYFIILDILAFTIGVIDVKKNRVNMLSIAAIIVSLWFLAPFIFGMIMILFFPHV